MIHRVYTVCEYTKIGACEVPYLLQAQELNNVFFV